MPSDVKIDLKTIEAIIASQNPVLRNLQITQTYSEVNSALSGLLGRKNVSWCAYATWASKTAGQFIRKDNLDHIIDDFLRDKNLVKEMLSSIPGAMTWFGWKVKIDDSFLAKTLNETAQEASQQVAAGNLLVFAELAPLYEKFINSFSDAGSFSQEKLDEFLSVFDDEKESKEKLKRAYSCYYQAIFEENPKAKAELIFLANLLVGYHEQIRLDPAINKSIAAPIEQVLRKKLLSSMDRWIESTIPRLFYYLLLPFLKSRIAPLVDRLAERWRVITTGELMKIEVPEGHLDLSEDIPTVPCKSTGVFPKELETIENPELQQILKQLDFTPDSLEGSGAKDWGKISDRMNFIADFFRTAQQDEKLFTPPFNTKQTSEIKNNLVPSGRL